MPPPVLQQQLGEEAIGYAHAVKIEALARLGELLKATERASGAEGIGQPKCAVPGRYRTQPPTLSTLGLSKKTSMIAQQLAALPTLRGDSNCPIDWTMFPGRFTKRWPASVTTSSAVQEVPARSRRETLPWQAVGSVCFEAPGSRIA